MKELTIEAKIENTAKVTAFLEEMLEEADCPMRTVMQISVAVDEVLTNIASYAYPGSTGTSTVRAEIDEGARRLELVFIDSGIPYNPLEAKEPDITLSAEERQIGGLGIFMVRKLMDEVLYRREGEKNILTIHKAI